ncbi:hypothetical protein [Bradyrhizobium oligotrophicum]|uniref:hypothetical protein n=1 Tax=Bradyrhizobium oligotrophicum TaxID=44255 RepID=UPI001181A5E4|nr:hypothetical protein [Bradyrhizobium oligotrophicum]
MDTWIAPRSADRRASTVAQAALERAGRIEQGGAPCRHIITAFDAAELELGCMRLSTVNPTGQQPDMSMIEKRG